MLKSQNWVIAAIKVGGTIAQIDATRLFKFLKKWDGDKPVFGVASAYELDGPPMLFDPDEAKIEADLIQKLGGGDFYIFALPCPTMEVRADARWPDSR